MARIYYKKMKWGMPLQYDNGGVRKFLKLKGEPATVIIGPESYVQFTYEKHLSEQAYINLISKEVDKLLK